MWAILTAHCGKLLRPCAATREPIAAKTTVVVKRIVNSSGVIARRSDVCACSKRGDQNVSATARATRCNYILKAKEAAASTGTGKLIFVRIMMGRMRAPGIS